jgi:hypothetical protein
MIAVAFGVLAVIALFIYFYFKNQPTGPCDSIFEQTAPKLAITLQHLKTNGGMVIGSQQVQDVAESAQRMGILCKTCCIAQVNGKINAEQYLACLNTTKDYETRIVQVASSVDQASIAKSRGDAQLAQQKTAQAITGCRRCSYHNSEPQSHHP